MRSLLLVLAVAGSVLLMGCGDSSELNKADSATLKNNLNRDLTPDEVKQLGGGAPAEAPKKETN